MDPDSCLKGQGFEIDDRRSKRWEVLPWDCEECEANDALDEGEEDENGYEPTVAGAQFRSAEADDEDTDEEDDDEESIDLAEYNEEEAAQYVREIDDSVLSQDNFLRAMDLSSAELRVRQREAGLVYGLTDYVNDRDTPGVTQTEIDHRQHYPGSARHDFSLMQARQRTDLVYMRLANRSEAEWFGDQTYSERTFDTHSNVLDPPDEHMEFWAGEVLAQHGDGFRPKHPDDDSSLDERRTNHVRFSPTNLRNQAQAAPFARSMFEIDGSPEDLASQAEQLTNVQFEKVSGIHGRRYHPYRDQQRYEPNVRGQGFLEVPEGDDQHPLSPYQVRHLQENDELWQMSAYPPSLARDHAF